jgi:hypothetical protein
VHRRRLEVRARRPCMSASRRSPLGLRSSMLPARADDACYLVHRMLPMLPVIDPQVLFEIRRVTTASKLERFRRGARPARPCMHPSAPSRRDSKYSTPISTRAHGRMTLTRRCVVFIRRATRRQVVGSSGAHRGFQSGHHGDIIVAHGTGRAHRIPQAEHIVEAITCC